MFGIFTEDTPVAIEDELILPAEIIIDDFKEKLNIPVSYWGLSDYKQSWLKSLESGLANKDHAVLAVSMYEPSCTNFVFIWVLYFSNEDVFIQNKVLFLDEHPDFDVENINNLINQRITHNEDGMKISEWNTDLDSVLHFYNSLKK